MAERLLPYEDLRPLGITASKVTLWRWEAAGKFPKRVKVSPGQVAWVPSEVDEWIKAKITARDSSEKVAA